MPIYELGYRHWEGELRGPLWRWWPITRTGLALAFRSKLLRRFLFLAWAPLLYFAPAFFFVGYMSEPGAAGGGAAADFARMALGPELAERLREDPEAVRPAAWALIFYYFFSFTQSTLTMLVVAIVGPPLISQDVRNKAFLVYFSKPITKWEYLFGKAAVLLTYIFLVTLFPALVLYLVSIAFSPSLGALLNTAVVLVRILAASAVVAVPITLLVLFLSSLVTDARYAMFSWVAICLMGVALYLTLTLMDGVRDADWIFLTSLREVTLVAVQHIFDVAGQLEAVAGPMASYDLRELIRWLKPQYSPALALGFLAVLSALCFAGVTRRISAPMRI